MVIELTESVAEQMELGNMECAEVVSQLASAHHYCRHYLTASQSVLRRLKRCQQLDSNASMVLDDIKGHYVTRQEALENVGFKLVIDYDCKTHREENCIYVNPSEKGVNLDFDKETVGLFEDTSDGDFYEIIARNYLQRKCTNKGGFLSIKFESAKGGGSGTCNDYCRYAKKAKRLMLCIVERDIKCENSDIYGDTYNKIVEKDEAMSPFNCNYYGLEKVSEIENLIPICIIGEMNSCKSNAIIKNNISFNMSFFDMKKGFNKDDLEREDVRNHALHIMKNYPAEISKLQEYFETEQNADKLLKGFGRDLLKNVLDYEQDNYRLKNTKDEHLSEEQRYEWNLLGEKIFQWACCPSKGIRAKL